MIAIALIWSFKFGFYFCKRKVHFDVESFWLIRNCLIPTNYQLREKNKVQSLFWQQLNISSKMLTNTQIDDVFVFLQTRGWYKNGPRNQIEEWSDSRNVIVEFVHTYTRTFVRMCVFVIFNDNNLLKFMGLSR